MMRFDISVNSTMKGYAEDTNHLAIHLQIGVRTKVLEDKKPTGQKPQGQKPHAFSPNTDKRHMILDKCTCIFGFLLSF